MNKLKCYYQDFTVKAGRHHGNKIAGRMKNGAIEITLKINESMFYEPPTNNGWSKIIGISLNRFTQHKNSARLVWRCPNVNTLELGYYVYSDGLSPQDDTSLKGVLGTYTRDDMPKEVDISIFRLCDEWGFMVDGEGILITGTRQSTRRYYYGNPYVGGTYTINHDVILPIKTNHDEGIITG